MNKKLLTAIIAVLLGFIVGMVFSMILGIKFQNGTITTYTPDTILVPMIRSFTGFDISGHNAFSARYIGEFIVAAVPLILTGLSVAFAFKTGLFNIGAEGQVLVGSIAATLAGIYLDLPPIIHPIVCFLAAIIAGFIFGFIPGLLKAKFNVHEVVTCIMLNYVGMYLANMIFKALPGYANDKTPAIRDSAKISSDFLSQITQGSRLNWSILVVLVACLVFWFIIEKTTFGYRLKAIGHNKDAAKYAGMKVDSGIMMSMGISGAFAALAGACLVLGLFGYGRVLNSFENYGYNGIAVSLVGLNSAIGTVFSGGLFAMLQVSQPLMQSAGIPKDIAVIISALIIFFCAIPALYEKYIDRYEEKHKEKKLKKEKAKKAGGDA
ncbi:ABC transporter permease [Mycoplasma sp. P36-A1]|uniref:ABC transporter permease n=1 Tax=Mycoplasma sp. P36-A1 TaxID=3252900 RepID=UPI003C2B69A2